MTCNDDDTLLAGAAHIDITPPPDCLLDGFAARDHGCEGIHDELYAEAVAFSRHGDKAVILGLDLLGLTDDQIDTIWEKAERRFGLAPDRLFINCSHTHAGPMIRPRYNSKFCKDGEACLPDEDYIETLIEKILDAIDTSLGNMRPSRVEWAMGKTKIGIYRRSKDISIYKGVISKRHRIFENFPNFEKDVDRNCPALLFTGLDGKPIGLIFSASCHPTTMSYDNYTVSAEYPGAAKRILRERFDGVTPLFLQGIGGDVKPYRVADGDRFRSGTYEDVEAVGKELARDVIRALEKGTFPVDISIRTALKRYPLPLAFGWDEETYRIMSTENESEYRRIWAKHWLDRIASGETIPVSRDITLSIFELSPTLRFLGIAGELLTDMGWILEGLFRNGTTLPMGYTNGRIGYIPDSQVMKEGGYEPVETIYFTNDMPAPWRDDIEYILRLSFRDLERRLS